MNTAVGTGITLEDAVRDALTQLGATPDQVELRKLEEGSSGLLGTSSRPFRVRATFREGFGPKPEPPKPAPSATSARERDREDYGSEPEPGNERDRGGREREYSGSGSGGGRPSRAGRPERSGRPDRGDRPARTDRGDRPERAPRPYRAPLSPEERFEVDDAFLERVRTEAAWLMEQMGFGDCTITVEGQADEVLVGLSSEADEETLTGRRGDTRLSIQQILSRLVNPRRGPGAHVMVDVNGYWQRRRDMLLERVRGLAAQAIETGQEMTTEPMASEERRLVHRALAADGRVITESYGDGAMKRMAIRPMERSSS